MDEKAAYQQTVTDAKELFKNNRSVNDLKTAIVKLFASTAHPMTLIDGDLAKQVCKQTQSADAFFSPSDAALFGQATTSYNNTKDFPQEYLDRCLEAERRNGVVMVVPDKWFSKTALRHEIVHALQFKNNLPFVLKPAHLTTDQQKSLNRDALAFRDKLQNHNFIVRKFLIPLSWQFEVPYAFTKYTVKKLLGRIKPDSSQLGQAVRLNMKREMEVDWFMIRYGTLTSKFHHGALLMGDHLLQYLRSYRLD